MNLIVLPNQLYLIVKLYINRPEFLPDTHGLSQIKAVYLLDNDKFVECECHLLKELE